MSENIENIKLILKAVKKFPLNSHINSQIVKPMSEAINAKYNAELSEKLNNITTELIKKYEFDFFKKIDKEYKHQDFYFKYDNDNRKAFIVYHGIKTDKVKAIIKKIRIAFLEYCIKKEQENK